MSDVLPVADGCERIEFEVSGKPFWFDVEPMTLDTIAEIQQQIASHTRQLKAERRELTEVEMCKVVFSVIAKQWSLMDGDQMRPISLHTIGKLPILFGAALFEWLSESDFLDASIAFASMQTKGGASSSPRKVSRTHPTAKG